MEMGDQLDLFGHGRTQAGGVDLMPPLDEVVTGLTAPTPLPGQMDLFGDRWLRSATARTALESFDLDTATAALREAVRLYPTDFALLERAEVIARLASTLRQARQRETSEARALSAIASHIPSFLAVAWHQHVARTMEDEAGPGAVVDGVPAGLHWFFAGDLTRAEDALRATLAHSPANGRAGGYLGDVLTALAREGEARIAYREALAVAPLEVDFENVADPAVRDLPTLAEDEYELPGAPAEWAAAVGVVEGVFMPPSIARQDGVAGPVDERLAPGLRFYLWLATERAAKGDSDRILCRRAMKELGPRLFKRFLDRRR